LGETDEEGCVLARQALSGYGELAFGQVDPGDHDVSSEPTKQDLNEKAVSAREIEHVDGTIQSPSGNAGRFGKQFV
jgi:hypothetical protein